MDWIGSAKWTHLQDSNSVLLTNIKSTDEKYTTRYNSVNLNN